MDSDLRGSSSTVVFEKISLELIIADRLTHFLLPDVEGTKFGQFLDKCLVS